MPLPEEVAEFFDEDGATQQWLELVSQRIDGLENQLGAINVLLMRILSELHVNTADPKVHIQSTPYPHIQHPKPWTAYGIATGNWKTAG